MTTPNDTTPATPVATLPEDADAVLVAQAAEQDALEAAMVRFNTTDPVVAAFMAKRRAAEIARPRTAWVEEV